MSDGKRILQKQLKSARQRLEESFKNIVEKEKLANYYKYYANYYWVKSADIQVRLWLKELGESIYQRDLMTGEAGDLNSKIRMIENSLVHILANLKKCDDEAVQKNWRLRFLYETIHDYIKEVYKNSAELRRVIKKIKA